MGQHFLCSVAVIAVAFGVLVLVIFILKSLYVIWCHFLFVFVILLFLVGCDSFNDLIVVVVSAMAVI